MKKYELPQLDYPYDGLLPFISERIMKLHHQTHHQGYVNGANTSLEALEKARQEGNLPEMRALLRNLSFAVGGHVLHSLFWKNLIPAASQPKVPAQLESILSDEFGSLDRFKEEFQAAAMVVEGSGWAVLFFCAELGRPLLTQIEKHHLQVYPGFRILLVLDVWEHAYYLDYQTDREKYVRSFWEVVNWEAVASRLPKS